MAPRDADERRDVGLAHLHMATATEVPRQAVAMLQYGLLACALIGFLGSLVMAASQK